MERAEAGDESMDNRRAYMPFYYGRWDDAARAHVDTGVSERSRAVRDGFRAEGAFDPPRTREAVSRLAAPVRHAHLVPELSGAGHPGGTRTEPPTMGGRRGNRGAGMAHRSRSGPAARSGPSA
jgi:hypothetical protein